jgi:hypothetical protein
MGDTRDNVFELIFSRWARCGVSTTYLALRDFLWAGNDHPAMHMIAWWGGITRPCVWRSLKLLREHGYVSWTRKGARNRYVLPKEEPATPDVRANIARLFQGEELWRGRQE